MFFHSLREKGGADGASNVLVQIVEYRRAFRVASTNGLAAGDHIVIRRPSTSEWIKSLGMTRLPGAFAYARLDWHPSSHNLVWDRTITAVDPSGQVEVDAPITTALEMGGGASQSSLLGHTPVREGGPPSEAIIDEFVHSYLAKDLMKMGPSDGLVADSAQNWVLAGDTTDAVLIYSRSGWSLTLTKPLAHPTYRGIWFDPHTGQPKYPIVVSVQTGTNVAKPDDKDWLLLLRSADRPR